MPIKTHVLALNLSGKNRIVHVHEEGPVIRYGNVCMNYLVGILGLCNRPLFDQKGNKIGLDVEHKNC